MADPIAKGEIARRLLEDPVMEEAYDRAEQMFYKEWRSAEDITRREMSWAKVQALDEVRKQLRTILSQGQHAAMS